MSEISWRAWNEEAFADAKNADKPLLLSLHAVWCQWCRQMDEQTYDNDALAQYITENFIPVRVDSDKRPDINARYTAGGWPTTCVLTPEADVIWAQTFVPPDAMAQVLPQILNAYRNDRANLSQQMQQQREQVKQRHTYPPLDPSIPVTPEIVRAVVNAPGGVKHNFDFAFGGFGREQKFPHVDAIELCLEQYLRSERIGAPDNDLKVVLDKTLAGMAGGGLQDEAGGFFRYTQTPDWREPHVEKLLEDNAQIARIYIRAFQALKNERWKQVAEKTLRYINTMLYDAERGVWGSAQAADTEYYAQPIAERSEWNPPTVDPTVLCGPNALAARTNIAWWQATGDNEALNRARRAMDFLLDTLAKPDGALDHFFSSDEDVLLRSGRTPAGLLGDAADTVAACLDLYEAGVGVFYLDRAEEIANWVRGHLEDPRSGGFFDSVVRPDAVGNMKVATKDLPDNMQMTDALLRLFLATGAEEHAQSGQKALQAFVPALSQLGIFGANLALAVERAVVSPILVHLIGDPGDPATNELLVAAHRPYRFERLVQLLDPSDEEDANQIEDLGYDAAQTPVVYVCVGTTCLEPTRDPAQVSELITSAG